MAERTAPEDAVLVLRFVDGLAWCDSTCRRGELVVWPAWTPEPLTPMESAAARPLLSLMGASADHQPRRASRDIVTVAA